MDDEDSPEMTVWSFEGPEFVQIVETGPGTGQVYAIVNPLPQETFQVQVSDGGSSPVSVTFTVSNVKPGHHKRPARLETSKHAAPSSSPSLHRYMNFND